MISVENKENVFGFETGADEVFTRESLDELSNGKGEDDDE